MKKIKLSSIVSFYFCILLFFCYTKVQVYQYDTKYLLGSIEDTIKIISYVEEGNYYDKYIAKNTNGDKFVAYFPHKTNFQKGNSVRIAGRFELPDLARNTGGFNYRRYLNSQKIYGSIFVEKFYLTDIGKFHFIDWVQEEINQTFAKLFPKNEMGLVLGMLIGETKDITKETLASFKETGITHLVAVSGSNVMYVLTAIQFVFNKICGKRKTYFISIFFLIIFMFVSGASSSVVRATMMVTLMILANVFYQKSDTLSNIIISALILLIMSPLIVYDVGFILSFGGTIGIVLLSKEFTSYFNTIKKMPEWLKETLSVTLSAQIALLPIMAYYFNTFSVLSIFTNMIVVPISGFITILGFFLFFISKVYFPFAELLSYALYMLAHFTIFIADIFSKIPFASMRIITPNLLEIILFYGILFVLVKKRKIPLINVFVILVLIVDIAYYHLPRSNIEVHFIDVGQGDAIYMRTNHNKVILIDGGGSETYDVGENILLPYLLNKRALHIDTVFSSHSDADHINGILTAVKNLRVDKVYIAKNALGYEELYKVANERGTKVIELTLGECVQVDSIFFTVIGPVKTISNQDVNGYSLVLKMNYQNTSFLFTGDIDQETELKLQNVKADILKVAHHGSNTSSNLKFIAKVKPRVAVIQVGKNNKYGHPNNDVIERLQKYNSKIFRTDEMGEITIIINKKGMIKVKECLK